MNPTVTYEIKTPNAEAVVPLEDLKTHALVDFPDDDALISDMGRMAEEFVEVTTGIGIGVKTISVHSSCDGVGWLPLTPVITAGIEKVGPNKFQTTEGDREMEVGHTTASLPYGLKSAICKMVAQAYWKREDQSEDNLYEVFGNSIDLIRALRRRRGI